MPRIDPQKYPIKLEHLDFEGMKKAVAGQRTYRKDLPYLLNLLQFLRDRRDSLVKSGQRDASEWEPFTTAEFGAYCEKRKIVVNGLFYYLGDTMKFIVRCSNDKDASWQLTHNLLSSLFSEFPKKTVLS